MVQAAIRGLAERQAEERRQLAMEDEASRRLRVSDESIVIFTTTLLPDACCTLRMYVCDVICAFCSTRSQNQSFSWLQ